MNEELKPCAHCGNPDIKIEDIQTNDGQCSIDGVRISCKCGATFSYTCYEYDNLDRYRAANKIKEAWNTRR